ncbi:unnamed protein product [Ranitomeya imitator]|uniref:Reverse transcriptase domain-containing protein n=1 Tax=Ranitomeya imitator TaxID=111125 RepID=A0ABN9L9P4_9NEOB|nr:unnamed protein product [Ranitomeya imitator]
MISNKYGLDIILLNIEFLQQEIRKYNSEMPILELEIKGLMKDNEWSGFYESLKIKFDNLRLELEDMKGRKWNRDMEDYKDGNISNWQRDSSENWKKKGTDPLKEKPSTSGKGEERSIGDNKKEKKGKGRSPVEKQVVTRSKEQGLSFGISSHVDWLQLTLDLQHFFRSIKLKEWFSHNTVEEHDLNSELNLKCVELKKKKSNFVPSSCPIAIEAFVLAVNGDIDNLKKECLKKFKRPNMSKGEVEALHELSHDNEIVIKKADKGGATVVMDREDYLNEIRRQLADPEVYERLPQDPKFEIARDIKMVLEKAKDKFIIDQDLYDFLTVKFPITPVIYILPKIHKSLVHPPGRPIVSGSDSIFSNIGIFLDNPIAGRAESFLRDTTDFLNKIKEVSILGEVLLASFDVTSLYTSIDHARGLEAVSQKLLSTHFSSDAREFIMELLKLVFTKNYFLFGDSFYLQLRGTAMGANMAPAYANIVMSVLEEDFVYVSHHFGLVAAWWRYIDDVFLIWTGTEELLHDFNKYLNTIDETIKFTLVYSKTDIQFLDVNVRCEANKLTTQLYTKPTDRNDLLSFESQHPKKMKESIPYSQLLHVKRIESDAYSRENFFQKVMKKFLDRGYPQSLLETQKGRVDDVNRKDLFHKNQGLKF